VAAASAVPYTNEAAQNVVNTLLQIASKEELLPHIPVNVWLWLTKRPPLPPICSGRYVGTRAHVVKAVRALKDIEILKSYFLLVWSEWSHFSPGSFNSVPGRLLTYDGIPGHRLAYVADSASSSSASSSSASSSSTPTSSVSIPIVQSQILQLLILQPLIL
jgi:hypothetical protein